MDRWDRPSIICLNRPGGLGSQKTLSHRSLPSGATGFGQDYTVFFVL